MELRKIMNMKNNPRNCADPLSEAEQYKDLNTGEWIALAKCLDRDFVVHTFQGIEKGKPGDWFVRVISHPGSWLKKANQTYLTHLECIMTDENFKKNFEKLR